MARTSQGEVGSIITLQDGVDVNPYIDSASMLVDAVCLSSGYTYTQLELIERWLSAFMYDVNYPRSKAQAITGGPSETLENIKVDLGLNVNKYGQVALRMDYKGNLAALEIRIKNGTQAPAESKWLGTPYCRSWR